MIALTDKFLYQSHLDIMSSVLTNYGQNHTVPALEAECMLMTLAPISPQDFCALLHESRYVGCEDPTIGQSSAEYHSESFLSDLSRLRTHYLCGL